MNFDADFGQYYCSARCERGAFCSGTIRTVNDSGNVYFNSNRDLKIEKEQESAPKEYVAPETLALGVKRMMELEKVWVTGFTLPPQSFLEECVRDIVLVERSQQRFRGFMGTPACCVTTLNSTGERCPAHNNRKFANVAVAQLAEQHPGKMQDEISNISCGFCF